MQLHLDGLPRRGRVWTRGRLSTMTTSEHWTRRLGMTSEALFVTNESGRIKYWNEGAHGLMGYPEAEVLGKRCYAVLCRAP